MGSTKKQQPSINITGGENVVGAINADGHAQVNLNQSSVHQTGDANFDKLFALIDEKIKARPEDPNVDKKEIQDQVKQIKDEAAQGEKANQSKLERWIRTLAGMAPDIVDVMAASLGGPVAGITAVVQKIAARAKAESGNQG